MQGLRTHSNKLWRWLVLDWHWPAAAIFCAVFLLAVLPVLALSASLALTLVFVQLPIYMLHQWEEHRGDLFRQYINRTIGGGREALTPAATFWINSLGVWGVDLLALYLAAFVRPGAGLVAAYLTLFNSLLHIGPALARREYNPGLLTALLLFVPVGGASAYWIGAKATLFEHALGLGGAILVHAIVVVHVITRLRRLQRFS